MNIKKVREDFSIFKYHQNLIYFDNAATTFKPQCVIDAVTNYYLNTANIGRGEYDLATNVTTQYEKVREKVANFINCATNEVVFSFGASDALNKIAFGFGKNVLKKGDIVLTTKLEHASNLLPWMKVCEEQSAILKYMPLNEFGQLMLDKINFKNVKMIVVSHVSNTFGYVNKIAKLCQLAHQYNIVVVVDGSQSVAHHKIDVKKLGCDFFVFPAHKMYGPTGVGVLYGKLSVLQKMQPIFFGGGSNATYTENSITLKDIPFCFETGTPAIEATLGLGCAIDYISTLDIEKIYKHEISLANYLKTKLNLLNNIEVYNDKENTNIVLFNVKNIFAQDVASYLSSKNIAVRSGQHCSKIYSEDATLRVSFAVYNTHEEVDYLVSLLQSITLEDTIDIFF